jgi:hypothetical protein
MITLLPSRLAACACEMVLLHFDAASLMHGFSVVMMIVQYVARWLMSDYFRLIALFVMFRMNQMLGLGCTRGPSTLAPDKFVEKGMVC